MGIDDELMESVSSLMEGGLREAVALEQEDKEKKGG